MEFKLEPYEGLSKRRAILQHLGDDRWEPCAWIDYDDVAPDDAHFIAEAALRGLLQYAADPVTHYRVRWGRKDGTIAEQVVEAKSERQAIGVAIPEWDNAISWVNVDGVIIGKQRRGEPDAELR